ncbi:MULTISPECIES: alpha/beta hydrolase [unclassified Nocardioides]|uniref:alpha/beta hydrolase n=1 Tax=unclassified Nocardioides TaxID=2615069 RepID=UPI0036141311
MSSPIRTVFLVAVAFVAIHVVDDSFVNPQPGTSAADHLVSGLVPLALLGVAAAAYVRARRGGVRAVVALLLGGFGLVAAAEGWYYTFEVGPSGDDYTGLLVLPAALALLGIGAVELWRSRRLDDRRGWRYSRRTLIGVGGVVLTFLVVQPFLMTYAYTHIARSEMPEPDLGVAHEEVTFETGDGVTLEGWWVPSRNGAAVIAFPGRAQGQDEARFLAAEGYGVLLFDRRGESTSGGDPNALGWDSTQDIDAAVEFVQEQPDVDPDRVGGIGFSVGGEMLLTAAARNDGLKAVVSEGAGIRSYREVAAVDSAEKWVGWPIWAVTTAGVALFSDSLPPENLKDLVADIAPRPVFLIHAERGQGGEVLSEEYAEAAGPTGAAWRTDSSHVGGYQAAPDEYEQRVTAFFDDALLR